MSGDGPPYTVYECYDCGVGLTNRDPERTTCDECGGRDWMEVVA